MTEVRGRARSERASAILASLIACASLSACSSRAVDPVDVGTRDTGSDSAAVPDAPPTEGGVPDAGEADVGPPDAGRSDAGVDAEVRDGGGADSAMDSGVADAGVADAGVADAGVLDAGVLDAGIADAGSDADVAPDAGAGDASPDAAGRIVIENAPLGAMGSSGQVLDASFWPGWRFQVTVAMTTTEVGFYSDRFGSGTGFAAIVRLSGPADAPDAADLSGTDVLGVSTIDLATGGVARDVTTGLSVALAPGWYAVIFGSGAFGETGASSAVGDHPRSPGAQLPFSLRQSDGALIMQAIDTRFFVEGVLD